MYKTYLKQAWQLMKQNRFYSAIYIAGTGLAIALVMVIAIVFYIKTTNMAPEAYRSRMLINERGNAKKKEGDHHNSASLSYKTMKGCFYSLQTPERVTGMVEPGYLKYHLKDVYFSLPGGIDKYSGYMGCTDGNFWQVFRFTFTDGKPFTQEEFESGFRKVVLSESLAREIFGAIDVAGQGMLINDVEYVVGGVVKDISPTMTLAYANIWVPYTCFPVLTEEDGDGIIGPIKAYILAHKTADFDAIRTELDEKIKEFNVSSGEFYFELDEGAPLSQRMLTIKKLDMMTDYRTVIRRYLFIGLIFLLVPAVNLSGLTTSRMQERVSEIGIRKAFGGRWTALIHQVLTENLLLTLLGGLLGLALSYLIILTLGESLLLGRFYLVNADVDLSTGMLMNFSVFFYALAVCLILNIFSSLIPVWNISRKNIVEAINDK